MPAKQELFEAVRAVLAGRLRDDSQVRELAMRIAEESTVLRRRIERAVDYARKGLRLEACAEAEADPSVFELAAAFDADDMRQWRSLCSKNRLPVPDRVPTASIGEIEEAIALTAPLRSRLARMRRQVLADAPAWDRLETLRELISRDPDNPAWQDDRAALEPVVAQELGDRCEAALRSGAVDEADGCVAHLEDGRWFWNGVGRVAARLRRQVGEAQAARLADAASQCLSRIEAERAAENELGARAEDDSMRVLEARLASLGASLPDEIEERLAAIRRWLSDREGDAAAREADRERVSALQRVLADGDASDVQLRAALGAAEQSAEGVPDELRSGVERRLREFQGARTKRRMLVIAAVVILVGVVALSAVVAVRSSTLDARIVAGCAGIQASIDAGQLEEARRRLQDLDSDPRIAEDARVDAVRVRLVDAESARNDRRSRVVRLLQDAGPADSPTSRRDLAEQARKLAVDADQQQLVSKWLDTHGVAVQRLRSERLSEGRRRLSELRDQAGTAVLDSGSRADETLNLWQQQVDDLARSLREIDELKDEISVIRQTIESRRRQLQSSRESQDCTQRLSELGRSASGTDVLVAAIAEFAERCPADPQVREMTATASGRPAWDAVIAWSAIWPRPSDVLAGRSQPDRDAVTKAIKAYIAEHPQTPFAAECVAVGQLLGPAPRWRDWLDVKLSELDWMQLWCIELKGGVRVYCRSDPSRERFEPRSGKSVKTLKVLTGSAGGEKLEQFDQSAIVSEGESPQRELAAQLKALLDQAGRSSNDVKAALDALAAVRAAERVDGALAVQLALGIMLELVEEAPEPIRRRLRAAIDALQMVKVDDIDWIRPDDPKARSRSSRARDELLKALKPDDWTRDYVAELRKASVPFLRAYEPAGVVVGAAPTRRFLPAPGMPKDASGDLFAVIPGLGDQPARLLRIGGTQAGEATLEDASITAGSMVFRSREVKSP